MTDLTKRQKTAFVTGAASGIGKSLTLELASRNYKVFATDVNYEGLKLVLEKFPENIIIYKFDVSKPEEIAKTHEFVISELNKLENQSPPKLDLLYNNAGIACSFPLIEVPDDAMSRILNISLQAPIRITKAFSDLVINAKGTIAFTGSVTKSLPIVYNGMYSTVKAGLEAYASTLSVEMEPFDVKVIHVVTGNINTGISDNTPWPEDSVYLSTQSLKESYRARKTFLEKKIKKMEPHDYAKSVISQIERANVKTFAIYEGPTSWSTPFVSNYLPRFVIVNFLRNLFKLSSAWDSLRKKMNAMNGDKTK
ncbi:unnamed protein product [Ambrosiozyma monospora]|uniref:Unnamed protein product n=1 Tax=Ambrosiozyma monospora TaxID=43982 RepID=A0A9W6YW98_AMBMO|nr:unnamed protein product [Ambrosiozyma monospora]